MSDAVESVKLDDSDIKLGHEAFTQLKEKLNQLSTGIITKAEYNNFSEKMNADLAEYDKKCSDLSVALEKEEKSRVDLETKFEFLEKNAFALTKKSAEGELGESSKFFVDMLKKDLKMSQPEESKWSSYCSSKYLRTDIATDGGYLVVPEFADFIIKNVVEISDVRSLANIVTVSKKSYEIPKRTGEPQGAWIDEGEEIPETQAVYGKEIILNHQLKVQTAISWEMSQDSEFDMANQIAMDTAEEFNRAEGQAFVRGDGNSKPEGLLYNSAVESFDSVNEGAIEYSDMVSLTGEIKVPYLKNARWAMNSRTLAAIRNIVDNQGMPIWQPTMDVANPFIILGYRYALLQDMPNIPIAGGIETTPVLFGDIRKAYTIVDRLGLTVLRDNSTLAGRGLMRFLFFKRVGGQVVQAEAIKKINVAAPAP